MSSCQICLNNINKVNKPIICPSCDETCCKKCFVNYLHVSGCEPFCMFCRKKPLKMDYIRQILPNSLVTAYEKYRLSLLFTNEKSLLPITQMKLNQEKLLHRIDSLTYYIGHIRDMKKTVKKNVDIEFVKEMNKLNDVMMYELRRIENSPDDISIIEYNRNLILNSFQEELKVLRKQRDEKYKKETKIYNELKTKYQFEIDNLSLQLNDNRLEKCYDSKCRGYVSLQTGICCGCNTLFCTDCHLQKKENHECDKEVVATLVELKKDSKPCPKCGVFINKVDGCDQIFCVVPTCQAVFSFSTGLLEKGQIHNPEYYRFLRDRNNGVIPENECIILPTRDDIKNYVKNNNLEKDIREQLLESYYIANKIKFNIDTLEQECDYEILRQMYLRNEIDETQWLRKLQLYVKKNEKNDELIQILNTAYKIMVNYFYALITNNIDLNYFFNHSNELFANSNHEIENLNEKFKSKDKKFFIQG
jgi:hypothetical protein